ncbi:hypothetical protein AGLY_016791 [Aphis glycines]|uniref:Uncharacterized protein n=1 Tax=Aphis glycines TaxID=307491 RepID=A0A6G0SWY0_APHGL|nr:hypothetical protein AGLY_016791 [Aphis glycines]
MLTEELILKMFTLLPKPNRRDPLLDTKCHITIGNDSMYIKSVNFVYDFNMYSTYYFWNIKDVCFVMYETIIHCINSVPYCNNNLLVSLEFLVHEHFLMCSVKRCADILTLSCTRDQLSLLFIQKSNILINPKFRMMISLQDIKSFNFSIILRMTEYCEGAPGLCGYGTSAVPGLQVPLYVVPLLFTSNRSLLGFERANVVPSTCYRNNKHQKEEL